MHVNVYNLLNWVLSMVLMKVTLVFSYISLRVWSHILVYEFDVNEIYIEFEWLRLNWNKWRIMFGQIVNVFESCIY